MAEDVPQTSDDVKLGLNRVKFFGAHGPDLGVREAVALHRSAWFEQYKFRDASSLRDAASASAIATSDVEHGTAARRDLGNNQLIDTVQIGLPLIGQTREYWRDSIISSHGIHVSTGANSFLDLLRRIVVGLTHFISMEPTFLPGVENHPQPRPYTDLIRSMQAAGSEYMQIWHLFAFKPEMTAHLARFSQAVLRDPAPISPGIRELIAFFTTTKVRNRYAAHHAAGRNSGHSRTV